MTSITKLSVVDELYWAEKNAQTLEQFANKIDGFSEREAYEIQQLLVDKKIEQEQTEQIGWKLGLTSKAKQQMMGVHEPSYGVLLKNMYLIEGGKHDLAPYIHPKLEPELAFVLKKPLKGSPTLEEVIDAIDFVLPAFEIIDSRFERFKFTLLDAIADNSSSSRYILGNRPIKLDADFIDALGVVYYKNGEIVASTTSGAVMQNPLISIQWLAEKLHERNLHLKPRDLILSGSISEAIEIKPGDFFHASFQSLGTISVSFTGGAGECHSSK
ncbi:fumarylacetoacetate hydrolase family protein [Solibacillus sp. FSL W7-1436]|uniref:2-keto-4-pentenoate hydratase n=1 Tax=Solibacillus sp. FSL W7-1436 TaxID=2921705 RepID=UPI0030F73B7C